jgi:hypothetical protein
VGSEDVADWLLSESEDDFQYFVERLDDVELDAFLIRALRVHEELSIGLSMDGVRRASLGTVERRLRKLKREQQRRAMSHVMPFARGAGMSKIKLARPPRLLGGPLLRRLLRPVAYKRYVEPHIEDMIEEYFARIAEGDERGARWAVIRAHLYVIPSWVWALVWPLIARVIEWIRT